MSKKNFFKNHFHQFRWKSKRIINPQSYYFNIYILKRKHKNKFFQIRKIRITSHIYLVRQFDKFCIYFRNMSVIYFNILVHHCYQFVVIKISVKIIIRKFGEFVFPFTFKVNDIGDKHLCIRSQIVWKLGKHQLAKILEIWATFKFMIASKTWKHFWLLYKTNKYERELTIFGIL